MKRLFLLFITLHFTAAAFSQYEDILVPKNRLMFNLFTVKARQVADGGQKYYPYAFNGLSYHRSLSENGYLRFRFNYFYKEEEREETDPLRTGKFKELEFSAGYQRQFTRFFIKPYLAGDLAIIRNNSLRENTGILIESYEKKDINHFAVGILPAAGLRIETGTALNFAIETNLELLWCKSEGTTFYHVASTVPIKGTVDESGFLARWNPVSALYISLDF